MKHQTPLIALLAFIATVSGYMIHKMSWLARVGIHWFYKEYAIFRNWGQTSVAEFTVFMGLLALHAVVDKKAKPQTARLVHIGGIAVAALGLYFTYNDFRGDFSHRLAGERFHIGFYLFWVGWILISLNFLFRKPKVLTTL